MIDTITDAQIRLALALAELNIEAAADEDEFEDISLDSTIEETLAILLPQGSEISNADRLTLGGRIIEVYENSDIAALIRLARPS